MKKILDKMDIEDNLLTRKKTPKYSCEIELLLDHLQTLVSYLLMDAEASRRELFACRDLLEGE